VQNKPKKNNQNQIGIWRKVVYIFILVIVVPVIFFISFELILNITGYGYISDFFKEREIQASKYYTDNMNFSKRFFPAELTRPPNHFKIPVHKSSNTYRIVILGGSAAMGDPAPSFAFSRILEKILKNKYPRTDFEVKNLAITAINSNVVLPISRDCKKIDPDLFIVYLGNNEVIGPYGPGTVFEGFTKNLGLIRSDIFLKSTRIGQLLNNIITQFRNKKQKYKKWGGVNMFLKNRMRPNDERMTWVYHHFKENLQDIGKVAKKIDSKVILCTVPTNLKDCPPFGSLHKEDFSGNSKKRWEKNYNQGVQYQKSRQYEKAINFYQNARNIDSVFAGLHYRMGKCLLKTGKYKKSRRQFELARNLDALKFRADNTINQIIRNVARSRNDILLSDFMKTFEQNSIHKITGDNLFYDHVHMNFNGNYLIAKELSKKIATVFPAKQSSNYLSQKTVKKDLAFTPWEKYRIKQDLFRRLQSPAFSERIDNKKKIKTIRQELDSLNLLLQDKDIVHKVSRNYSRSIKNNDDWIINNNFGLYLLNWLNKPADAEQQFNSVLSEIPYDYLSLNNLGLAYAKMGKVNKAIQKINQALAIKPNFSDAKLNLGKIMEARGKFNEAIKYYKDGSADPKLLAQVYNEYGRNLLQQEKLDSAKIQFTKALRYRTNYTDAVISLSDVFVQKGQLDSARKYLSNFINKDTTSFVICNKLGNIYFSQKNYRKAIIQYKNSLEIDPQQPQILNKVGLAYSRSRKYEQGEKYLKKAIQSKKNFLTARNNLAGLYNQMGKYDEMIPQLQAALKIKPNSPTLHNNLGAAYLRQEKLEEAIAHFEKALEIEPNYKSARKNLNYVRSRMENSKKNN